MKPLPPETIAVLPEMPLVQQETSTLSSNGLEYLTKLIYEDAYKRITLNLNEYGQITKTSTKELT